MVRRGPGAVNRRGPSAHRETHPGATVHYMTERVDQGTVILQERVPIRADDTVHTLVQRTKVEVGAGL